MEQLTSSTQSRRELYFHYSPSNAIHSQASFHVIQCTYSQVLASFPVSTPSFFSHVVKKKLGVETENEATQVHAASNLCMQLSEQVLQEM